MSDQPPPSPWATTFRNDLDRLPVQRPLLPREQPTRRDLSTVILTPELAALASWHHHHYLRPAAGPPGGRERPEFRPFTGNEPMPGEPDGTADLAALISVSHHDCPDPHGLRDAYARIIDEVAYARLLWHAARHNAFVLQTLHDAGNAMASYRAADAEVRAADAALNTAPDGMWRAAITRLIDAREAVLTAARELDRLAGLIQDAHKAMPDGCYLHTRPVHQIAADARIDLTDAWPDDIGDGYGLVFDRRREYATQDRRIAEINRLAGPPRG